MMFKTLLLSITLLFLVNFALAAVETPSSPSDFFSDADRAAIISLIKSQRAEDGSFGSLADTFYAVNLSRSSQFAEAAQLVDASLTCQYALQYLNNKQNVETLYYAISIVETLNCGSSVGNDVTNILVSGLRPNTKIETKYLAVQAISRLQAAGHITSFDESDLAGLVPSLANLQEADGTFRSELDVKGSSALNAGYVSQILTSLTLQDDQEEAADEIAESLVEVFNGGNEEDGDVFYFTGDSRLDDLKATALVFSGVNALVQAGVGDRESLKQAINKEVVVELAEFAIKRKHVSTLRDAFYLNILLETISNNVWHVPLVLTLPQGSLFATSKRGGTGTANEGFARVRVTDIYGKFATPATVYIVRAFPVDDARDIILTNQEAVSVPDDNTAYSFNFLAKKPEPGYYTIEFSVTPKGQSRFSAVKDQRNIKVVSPVEVVDVEVRVSDSKDPEEQYRASRYTPSYPSPVKDVITVGPLQYVTVSFRVRNQVSGKPVKVHQAFVRLTHPDSGHSAVFNTRPVKNGYELTLDLQAHSDTLGAVSGKYNLDLVVGDPFISNPISWNLASLSLTLSKAQTQQAQTQRGVVRKSLEGKITGSDGPRPDIVHQFRKPDRRPPSVFSLAFTALVLAPILILLGGIAVVGANLENYPGGTGAMFALGFHVCLGLILGLFVLYWFALNIVQTLGYLFVLSIPTVFLGLKTLQAVNNIKTKVKSS